MCRVRRRLVRERELSLYWLDRTFRLKRENDIDGVVPGEAAAAVYVQQERPSSVGEVQVVGLELAHEKATPLNSEPLLGHGLADATRTAMKEACWGFHEVDLRLADVTGETYGFREHTLAEARLVATVRKQAQPIWHAADCIGDSGAAAGLVQLAWVSAAMRKRYAPGPRALCFTSALTGERAVLAICSGPSALGSTGGVGHGM